ncbi:YbaK/EbsC family protein [Brevibacterium sp. 5221]|uniref:YbaK/EbsC family protein n=1 Tax=Brevibacterium rongguiense TaxID=2695267 RepID=A0A6N9HA49_9MICO|nr:MULTISPECIES: YbaK/EbsC family protein [Brevibacterium]MYM20927.1 YbaK/EbsC family protein [Brevibacterium rongguiense]WAL39218.1 YbaK/EbsC family protein [Brevibacterium sp. BRM-1]
MHARNERVQQALREAGIDSRVRILDVHTPTAQAAAEQLGVEVGAIANSLIFAARRAADTAAHEDAARPSAVLVMTSGAHRVDTAFVAEQLGLAALERATPQLVKEATGQVIGGVAPTGHPRPVATYVDRALAAFPVLWAAGGTPDSMVDLTYEQLLALTHGKEIDVERP